MERGYIADPNKTSCAQTVGHRSQAQTTREHCASLIQPKTPHRGKGVHVIDLNCLLYAVVSAYLSTLRSNYNITLGFSNSSMNEGEDVS